MLSKIVRQLKVWRYGVRHLNTRHIQARIGQYWTNAKGQNLYVLCVRGESVHVRIRGTEQENFALFCNDSLLGFTDRVREGKFWLED
jgi:hypothetical protein